MLRLLYFFIFYLSHLHLAQCDWQQTYNIGRSEERAEEHWDYCDQNKWCKISSSCCGKNQSPIELWDSDNKTKMTPFIFIDYSTLPKAVTCENNGHSISCSFTGCTPKISGGGLPQQMYILHSFHFHWGVNNYFGAEHTLNDRLAPMELHLVHYNSKFSSLTDAIASGERDALAVLGVLYWIDSKNSNPSLDKITSRLQCLQYNGQSTSAKPFILRQLIPDSTCYFFRYFGSLTTPTCDEIVAWTVFRDPGYITPAQMNAFRATYSTGANERDVKTIANNYRDLQPLNERIVYQGVESPNKYSNY